MENSNVLLDTQIALWILLDHEKVPKDLIFQLESENCSLYFHQISIWEIQIKYNIGKLPLPSPPEKLIRPAIKKSGLRYADIKDEGIYFLHKLPIIHKDPFDRLLIAHACVNGWKILTSDKVFENYPVRTITVS